MNKEKLEMMRFNIRRKFWNSKFGRFIMLLDDRIDAYWRRFVLDPLFRLKCRLLKAKIKLVNKIIMFGADTGILEIVETDEYGRENRYREYRYM